MKIIEKNQGYTLIEMIITIGLIAIAISLSGFGLSTIYNSNVNTYASRIVNDIKLVQTKEMASNNINYKLVMEKDTGIYKVKILQGAGDPANPYKNYDLPKVMVIKKHNGSTFVDIDTLFEEEVTFEFDVSSGKVLSNATGDAGTPFATGAGRYEISSSTSNRVIEFVVVEQNGRVYVDE